MAPSPSSRRSLVLWIRTHVVLCGSFSLFDAHFRSHTSSYRVSPIPCMYMSPVFFSTHMFFGASFLLSASLVTTPLRLITSPSLIPACFVRADLHAERIGHGFHLFHDHLVMKKHDTTPSQYVSGLVQYLAEHRITLECCISSNLQVHVSTPQYMSLSPGPCPSAWTAKPSHPSLT